LAVCRYSNGQHGRELDQITYRLSQMFEPVSKEPMAPSTGAWIPPVSVEETEHELILVGELPGMKPADVEVQLENNVLTISGSKTEYRNEGEEHRRYHVWERSYGSFERSFRLPYTVRADDISASFEDGLLRIRMPKAPEARTRRIEVRGSATGAASDGTTQETK
jgi:HSP20 family protein